MVSFEQTAKYIQARESYTDLICFSDGITARIEENKGKMINE